MTHYGGVNYAEGNEAVKGKKRPREDGMEGDELPTPAGVPSLSLGREGMLSTWHT